MTDPTRTPGSHARACLRFLCVPLRRQTRNPHDLQLNGGASMLLSTEHEVAREAGCCMDRAHGHRARFVTVIAVMGGISDDHQQGRADCPGQRMNPEPDIWRLVQMENRPCGRLSDLATLRFTCEGHDRRLPLLRQRSPCRCRHQPRIRWPGCRAGHRFATQGILPRHPVSP